MVDGVFFYIDVSKNNPIEYYWTTFNHYRMYLKVFKAVDNDSDVTINSVRIEGVEDIKFTELYSELNKEIVFKEFNIQERQRYDGHIRLTNDLSSTKMGLNEDSKLKVTVNVTVANGENTTTQDIVFLLKFVGGGVVFDYVSRDPWVLK